MRYFILVLLFALSFVSYSCSSLWTSKHKTDSSSIVGGALIDEPGNHTREVYFLEGAEELNLENYYFDIPVVYNAAVKKWIHYYLNRGRNYFETYSARGGRYAPLLGKMLEDNGLPHDLIYLAMAESGFHTKARSYARAVGLWQFIPSTGLIYGLKIDWYIDERRDPVKSTIAASKYLKKLYEDYGDWELAASAYNAGEGKVNRAMARYKTDNFWDLRKRRYLKSETRNYVPKIMALAILGKNLKSFGFDNIEFHGPIDYAEIEVPGNTDLVALAQEMQIDVEEIYSLNPELRRWYTPPYVETYRLKIPIEAEDIYEERCKDKYFTASAFQKYKTKSACTLAQVAKKFKIKPSSVLEDINSIPVNTRLAKGQVVMLPFREGQNIRDAMYADLYWRPRKHVRIRRAYRRQIRLAKANGQKINNPKEYYTVQKGDSLWSVSKKTGTPINVLINTNITIVERRMIRQGDKLAVR
ncbi:MAG: transglycosylase SLT domain-containing protein [Deltaproteobacteria bacterium]|nr:transglycosylase SLT domain-containing protein [Deltaproteobacteria bacterium]